MITLPDGSTIDAKALVAKFMGRGVGVKQAKPKRDTSKASQSQGAVCMRRLRAERRKLDVSGFPARDRGPREDTLTKRQKEKRNTGRVKKVRLAMRKLRKARKELSGR